MKNLMDNYFYDIEQKITYKRKYGDLNVNKTNPRIQKSITSIIYLLKSYSNPKSEKNTISYNNNDKILIQKQKTTKMNIWIIIKNTPI